MSTLVWIGREGQHQRRAVRRQRAGRRIDPECIRKMLAAGDARRTRTAIAGDDIQILLGWMRPGVLDIGRRRYRVAFNERGAVDVNAVERELRSKARIEHIFGV